MEETAPSLTVACINSPESVTISGDLQQLQILAAALADGRYGPNIFHRRLQVQVAYHSPHMSSVAEDYFARLDDLESITERAANADDKSNNPPPIMISSVTGEVVHPTVLRKPEYWVENMTKPVRFSDAVTQLASQSIGTLRKKLDGSHRMAASVQILVEIGPHSSLQGPIRQILSPNPSTTKLIYYSAMKRHSPADRTILTLAGQLSCHGYPVNLAQASGLDKDERDQIKSRCVLTTLPEYPFDHSRKYWSTGRLGQEYRFRRHAKLDLLGKPAIDWNPLNARWTNFFKLSELPWAADHKINGAVVYPAVGMVIMAAEAAKQLAQASTNRLINGYRVSKGYFSAALVIPTAAEGIETHLHLIPIQDNSNRDSPSWEYHLYSCENGQWHENSHGAISVEYASQSNDVADSEEPARLAQSRKTHHDAEANAKSVLSRVDFYKALWNSGYTFGPSFRAMDNITFSDHDGCWQSTADVRCFDWHEENNANHRQEHIVHPTTSDGIIQTSLAVMARGGMGIFQTAVPIEVENFWVSNSGLTHPQTLSVKSRARLLSKGATGFEASVTALDNTSGKVLLYAKRFRLKFVTAMGSAQETNQEPHIYYHLQWKPDIDLFRGSSISGGFHNLEGLEFVTQFLDMATFKNPNMKIIHFSDCLDRSRSLILDRFFGQNTCKTPVLCHGTYTLVDLAFTKPEELQRLPEEYSGIDVISWDMRQSPAPEVISQNTFELVIISHAREDDKRTNGILQCASKVLIPGGRVILLETENYIYDANPVDENLQVNRVDQNFTTSKSVSGRNHHSSDTLQNNGFLEVDTYVDDKCCTAMLTSTKTHTQNEGLVLVQFIMVIDQSSEHQRRVSKILKHSLQKLAGPRCDIHSLQDTSPSDKTSEQVYIFLEDLERPLLEDISSENFSKFRDIFVSAKGIFWVTGRDKSLAQQPNSSIVDGLARVARVENNQAVIVTVSLERSSAEEQAGLITKLANKTNFGSENQNYESAYTQDGDNVNICRVIAAKDLAREVFHQSLPVQSKVQAFGAGPPLLLAATTPGLLDSLQWVEDTSYYEPLAPDEVEVEVHMIGLNFRDLLLALGRINGTTLGTECAGVVSRAGEDTDFEVGERVALFTPTAFATYTIIKAVAVARVPAGVSLTQAASVPSQFVAAWDALSDMGKLQRGETILIHSGAGRTSQAAIQIAQYLGGEIFTTVGSSEKKQFLMNEYDIPEDHIFYSRDTSFADGIRRMTNDRGVDVVLNSLAGESLLATWDLIAPYGRFIEIGKKDIDANSNLPMRPFMRGATFASLDVSSKFYDAPWLVKNNIEKLLDMFQDGTFQPAQPVHVLPVSDVQKGMRMLQEGKMMGKIVFEISREAPVPTILKTKPSFLFSSEKTYLIAGGTGGLGLAIARWMVEERKAENLILLSKSGYQSQDVSETIANLRRTGARVEVLQCDVTNLDLLRRVLGRLDDDMPPIGGCIQASMVLRDTLLANMSHTDWRAATDPKTIGSWNLHTVLPKGLDFFVLLSSVAGILGSAGQANYAAGNTYMDSLARYRVMQGEKAIALDLGVMLENGFLASKQALRNRILAGGFLTGVSPAEFFAVLDKYCNPQQEVLSATDSQLVVGLAPASKILKKAANDAPFPTLPFYRHILYRADQIDESQNGDLDGSAKIRQRFLAAETLEDSGAVIAEAFLERLLSSMPGSGENAGGDVEALRKPVRFYGVDSLLAIELRGWLAKEFGADIPIFEILGEGTLLSLGFSAASKSSLRLSTDTS
ncbi:Reducing polyketide synthase FUB1 [Lachnellula suecica]|uniref:Reducing polyketide synthase FUB1 n=1 Tax=Lachnellula suecica TaxID=602035 RepID=A0A8T9CI14_9HELO|nr:Reducing polyketide synthase FUB1 [Lachnellula suecica]